MNGNFLKTTAATLTMATAMTGCVPAGPSVEGRTRNEATVSTRDGQRSLGSGVLVVVNCQQNKADGSGRVLGGEVKEGSNAGLHFTGLERDDFEPTPSDADSQTPPQDRTGFLADC